VVHVQYFEGSSFFLIHEGTGKKTEVYGPPVLSPGKDLFFTYNCDIAAGFSKNGIQVFRINKDASITGLAEIQKSWGPINVRWSGSNGIEFTRLDLIEGGYISSLGEIEIAGNKYILIE